MRRESKEDEKDEEERIPSDRSESKREQQPRMETLDMGALAKAERNEFSDAHERVGRQLDADVLVVFELPDGSEGDHEFKMGHTVEVLKSFVQDEYEIPMAEQQLFLDDRPMLDPLTLSDYPIDPSRPVFIRVQGELPESALCSKK